MSDLLGRMIARARAPLSPVQPILPSLYEPVTRPEPEPEPVTPWPVHEFAREEGSSQKARPLESTVTPEADGIQAGGLPPVDQPIERRDSGPRLSRPRQVDQPIERHDSGPRLSEPRQVDQPIERHDSGPRLSRPRQVDQPIERHDSGLQIPEVRQVDSRRSERLISTPEEGSGLDREPSRAPSGEARAIGRSEPAAARPEPADKGQEEPSRPNVPAGSSQTERSQQVLRPISVQAARERKPEATVNLRSLETDFPPARPGTRRPGQRESGKREVEDPIRDSPLEVNIAIGHIEVRSVPRVEAPRRPAAKPRVTLDEYLRRRNGDSR